MSTREKFKSSENLGIENKNLKAVPPARCALEDIPAPGGFDASLPG
jgi:hypothetical protein